MPDKFVPVRPLAESLSHLRRDPEALPSVPRLVVRPVPSWADQVASTELGAVVKAATEAAPGGAPAVTVKRGALTRARLGEILARAQSTGDYAEYQRVRPEAVRLGFV